MKLLKRLLCISLLILLCLPMVLLAAIATGTNSGFVTTAPTANPSGITTLVDWDCWATRDTAPVGAVTITKIGWWCDNVINETNFEVGLYSDNAGGGYPNSLLYSSTVNSSGTAAGWKTVTVNWSVTAGTVYWIAAQVDDVATGPITDRGTIVGARRSLYLDQNALPATWGDRGEYADSAYAIYAVWEGAPPEEEAATGSQVIIILQ